MRFLVEADVGTMVPAWDHGRTIEAPSAEAAVMRFAAEDFPEGPVRQIRRGYAPDVYHATVTTEGSEDRLLFRCRPESAVKEARGNEVE